MGKRPLRAVGLLEQVAREVSARVAKRVYRVTGVRVAHDDAELFVRGHADAGLLRIVK